MANKIPLHRFASVHSMTIKVGGYACLLIAIVATPIINRENKKTFSPLLKGEICLNATDAISSNILTWFNGVGDTLCKKYVRQLCFTSQ